MFGKQNRCYALYINEKTRKISIKKLRLDERVLHYRDKAWTIDTDPLFYKNSAFYIVSDSVARPYELKIEKKEKEEGTIEASLFTPTAIKKITTSNFFKALMNPVGWGRADYFKAIMFGFGFYVLLRWLLLSIFGVSLP